MKKTSLLFLDSFTAHLTEAVKEAFRQSNTTVAVIPGGCTSILQPLDVSLNKPIKGYLRQSWEHYMLDNSSPHVNTPKPSKQLIVNWIEEANHMIDSNKCIVKKSFLVTGLSNSLGGYEDELIRNDTTRREIEEVIAEVFGEETLGFQDPQSDCDPFDSSSDEETPEVFITSSDKSMCASIGHSSEPNSASLITSGNEPDTTESESNV